MIDPKDQQNKKARPTDRRTGFALISDKTLCDRLFQLGAGVKIVVNLLQHKALPRLFECWQEIPDPCRWSYGRCQT